MQNRVTIFRNLLLLITIIAISFGCGEMLNDPTVDKETGEDINILIVDFNFFTTRATFKLVDVEDNTTIEEQANIWFTGENANDIVNFAGEKNDSYSTTEGQLELTFDPNVEVSASSPLEFAVNIEIDGYQSFSQGLQINSEGKKTFELQLTKESTDDDVLTGAEDPDDEGAFIFSIANTSSIKSASAEAEDSYKIKYTIQKSDIINFKDYYGRTFFASVEELDSAYDANPNDFIQLTIGKSTEYPQTVDRVMVDGEAKLVAFQRLETGMLNNIVIDDRKVYDLNGGSIEQTCTYSDSPIPAAFGLVTFETDSWVFYGTTEVYTALNFEYTLASSTLESLCSSGSSITFTSSMVSSFSIYADFYNDEGDVIYSECFTGDFPETFTLENIPAGSATMQFRDNNPAFQKITDVEIADLCEGDYEVEVLKAEGYTEYQVVLKAYCSDNPTVAIAPTYSGEYRIKDSGDDWQGVDMDGGIVNMLMKEDEDYQLRLLWDEEWETIDFSTSFDANGNYTGSLDIDIETEALDDGRTQLKIEYTFEQDICNDLGW